MRANAAMEATCFYDHELKCYVYENKSIWFCDMCGSQSKSNVSLYNCKICNFNVRNVCIGIYENQCKHDKLIQKIGNFMCIECDTVSINKYYYCEDCNNNICQKCIQSTQITNQFCNITIN